MEVRLNLYFIAFYNKGVESHTHIHSHSSSTPRSISWLYMMHVQIDLKSCKDPLAAVDITPSVRVDHRDPGYMQKYLEQRTMLKLPFP